MIVSTLAALTLSASAAQMNSSGDDSLAADALDYCGGIDAAVIDASKAASVSDIVSQIEQSGAQAVVITGARLTGQDLRPLAALLGGGCIVDSTLTNSRWTGVSVPDLRLVRSDLSGADLSGATLSRVRFEGVGLAETDFTDARMINARFVGAFGQLFLGGAKFYRAELGGAAFECGITIDAWCMDAYTARFMGARLDRADLTTLGIWDEEMLRGARLDQTAVSPRSLPYLGTATVAGPLILRASLPLEENEGLAQHAATITPEEFRELNAATLSHAADRPSFACVKAQTQVEKLICGEYASALRTADRDMAALYGEAKKGGKATAASQKAWLTKRNKCTDEECLAAAYQTRMNQLFAALGPRWALAPGQSVTYHDDVLPLPLSMRGSELYARIAPVLADASAQYITLTGMAGGRISAEGFALGSNAHMCDFGVDNARFDYKTGWYSGVSEDGTLVPLFRIWGDRLLMRYSGNMGDTPDEAQDFVSCGARASFGDLRDLGE